MQTRVYVDGFNLYYGALKGTKFKWLNLVELARHVLPADHTIASSSILPLEYLGYQTAMLLAINKSTLKRSIPCPK